MAKNVDGSEIQLGRMIYEPKFLNLREQIDKNLRLWTSNALQKRVTVQNLVSDDVFVYADQNMLDTVLRHLTSNAIKFTNQGDRVTISTQRICKEMVEKNGGHIWIESEVGKGTTVHFTIPITKD